MLINFSHYDLKVYLLVTRLRQVVSSIACITYTDMQENMWARLRCVTRVLGMRPIHAT